MCNKDSGSDINVYCCQKYRSKGKAHLVSGPGKLLISCCSCVSLRSTL